MNIKKLLPIAFCSVLFLYSCDDDDDKLDFNIPQVVENSFSSRYPDAAVKEWEREDSLLKAEFYQGEAESEAWFKMDGTWVKTETDFHQALPQPVADYVQYNFGGFSITEKEWVETPTQNYFELDLEQGKSELEIWIQEDGKLINIDGNCLEIPQSVKSAFAQRYPDTPVKEWEKEGLLLKAEFMNKTGEAEAWFDLDGVWVKTETDYHEALPKAVADYIAAHYEGYETDDVDWVETPNKSYFEVELEKGGQKIHLGILPDGSVVGTI